MPAHDDVEHFDRRAAIYEDSWVQRYVTQLHLAMLDAVGTSLDGAEPQCILDVGCGTGRLLRTAAERWPRVQLVGADPAERMVDIARGLVPTALFHVAGAEELPVADACVDLVLSSISLHHWADQEQGVREAARVLQPDGWMCLADIVLPAWIARLIHSCARTVQSLRHLLEASGMQVTAQTCCFAGRTVILVARKRPAAKPAQRDCRQPLRHAFQPPETRACPCRAARLDAGPAQG